MCNSLPAEGDEGDAAGRGQTNRECARMSQTPSYIQAYKCVLKRDRQKIQAYCLLKSNYDVDLESPHTLPLTLTSFFVGFYPRVLISGVTAAEGQ